MDSEKLPYEPNPKLLASIVLITTIALPTYAVIIAFVVLTYYLLLANNEDYNIPENFNGCFKITYTDENGILPKIKTNRLQIVVPNNGIVRLKISLKPKGFTLGTFSIWKKKLNHNFYFLKSDGTLVKEAIPKGEEESSDYFYVYNSGFVYETETKETKPVFYKKFDVKNGPIEKTCTEEMWKLKQKMYCNKCYNSQRTKKIVFIYNYDKLDTNWFQFR